MDSASPFRCVTCGAALSCDYEAEAACSECQHVYQRNQYGYLELISESPSGPGTTEDYAHAQLDTGDRLFVDFMKPLVEREPFKTVLDVGCGVGKITKLFTEAGADAYGVDLSCLSPLWAREGNDPRHFISGDATNLPFSDNYFDFVYSLGVIEHIGTIIGHCTLSNDYKAKRARFARELIRVTKSGGRIIIACPNKSFPFDIHHGPSDAAGKPRRFRTFLFNHTGLNVHKTWGKHHLPSLKEVRALFGGEAGASEMECLHLRGYFGFSRFTKGFLKPFAFITRSFVNNMPRPLLSTFFNPYVLVQIRK